MREFLDFANQLADAAGEVIRPYFGAHGAVEAKGDNSPVTIADRAAEQAMRALIAERYPNHGIFGEEFGQTIATGTPSPLAGEGWDEGASKAAKPNPRPPLPPSPARGEGFSDAPLVTPPSKNYCWLLDPIDGTRAFIAGGHEWGTLIALCENGVPILGILDQPVTGERWVGARGMNTTYVNAARPHPKNAQEHFSTSPKGEVPQASPLMHKTHHSVTSPLGEVEIASQAISGEGVVTITTRPCPSLANATLSTTSKNYFTPPQAASFVKLAGQCAEVIENDDCYAYGLLARGLRDVVVDAGLKPYDILALVPIIEGAGGKITGWNGAPVTLTNFANVVAVGDTARHHEALAVLGAAS